MSRGRRGDDALREALDASPHDDPFANAYGMGRIEPACRRLAGRRGDRSGSARMIANLRGCGRGWQAEDHQHDLRPMSSGAAVGPHSDNTGEEWEQTR